MADARASRSRRSGRRSPGSSAAGCSTPARVDGAPATRSPSAAQRDPGRRRPPDLRPAGGPSESTAGCSSSSRVPETRAGQAAPAALPADLARLRHRGAGRLGRARAPGRRGRRGARPPRPDRLRRPVPRRRTSAFGDVRARGRALVGPRPACTARYAEFLDRQAPVLRSGRRRRAVDAGAGLRRLRPAAHRLAPAALPRPGAAAGRCCRAAGTACGPRTCSTSCAARLAEPAHRHARRLDRRPQPLELSGRQRRRSPAPRPAPRRPRAGRCRCRPSPGSRCPPAAARPAPISRACAR